MKCLLTHPKIRLSIYSNGAEERNRKFISELLKKTVPKDEHLRDALMSKIAIFSKKDCADVRIVEEQEFLYIKSRIEDDAPFLGKIKGTVEKDVLVVNDNKFFYSEEGHTKLIIFSNSTGIARARTLGITSGSYCKDLLSILPRGGKLESTILLDDNMATIKPGEEKNRLHTLDIYNDSVIEEIATLKINSLDYTQEEIATLKIKSLDYIQKANHIFYVTGLLKKVFDEQKQDESLVDCLFRIQYIQNHSGHFQINRDQQKIQPIIFRWSP